MKHWVFDLDGTLVDSFSHYFAALEEIFRSHDVPFTPELRRSALTESLPIFFENHLGKQAVANSMSRLQTKSNRDAKEIRPFEGMPELIRLLLDQGNRVAVWTNRDLESAELILKHSGLAPLFEKCVSGSCVTLRKPNPEGLLTIRKHFACEPSSMIMVGDHEHDVLGAKTAGARAVRASWHSYWEVEPCKNSDYQFHRMADFHAWVASPTKI